MGPSLRTAIPLTFMMRLAREGLQDSFVCSRVREDELTRV